MGRADASGASCCTGGASAADEREHARGESVLPVREDVIAWDAPLAREGERVLLLVGSPRARGVSARYADELERALEAQGARVMRWDTAAHHVGGCIGCASCRPNGAAYGALREQGRSCVIDDDMEGLYALIDAADSAHIVCPAYFSGPPAQFKCVLDRMQPYWERRIGPAALPRDGRERRRFATLHVIGAGGDPYGFAPLETIVRSAFGAAGWRLGEVIDRIGWGQPRSEQDKTAFQPR